MRVMYKYPNHRTVCVKEILSAELKENNSLVLIGTDNELITVTPISATNAILFLTDLYNIGKADMTNINPSKIVITSVRS